jgi:amino acid transporter
MSEQRELPRFVGAVHEKFKTPYVALLITSIAILFLTINSSFVSALTISTITRLVVYATTCAALPVLRRRGDIAAAEFRAPFGNVFAIGSLILIIWLLANVDYAKEGLVFVAAIAVGFVIYFLGFAWKKFVNSA